MAVYLKELCEGAGLNVATVKILDVAAGTGLVGVELLKVGFKHIDYSQEMLDLAEEKGEFKSIWTSFIYNVFIAHRLL